MARFTRALNALLNGVASPITFDRSSSGWREV
jgi:hypothetical protein